MRYIHTKHIPREFVRRNSFSIACYKDYKILKVFWSKGGLDIVIDEDVPELWSDIKFGKEEVRFIFQINEEHSVHSKWKYIDTLLDGDERNIHLLQI